MKQQLLLTTIHSTAVIPVSHLFVVSILLNWLSLFDKNRCQFGDWSPKCDFHGKISMFWGNPNANAWYDDNRNTFSSIRAHVVRLISTLFSSISFVYKCLLSSKYYSIIVVWTHCTDLFPIFVSNNYTSALMNKLYYCTLFLFLSLTLLSACI